MLTSGEGELDDQLSAYLDDVIKDQESHRKLFYVYRVSRERLIDKEILVPEIVRKLKHEKSVHEEIDDKKKKKGKAKGGKKPPKGKKKGTKSPEPNDEESAAIRDIPSEEPTAASPVSEGEQTDAQVSVTAETPKSEATEASEALEDSVGPSTPRDEAIQEAEGKKKKGKKEKQKKKKDKVESVAVSDTEEEYVDEIVYVPKIIQEMQKDYTLHGAFGCIEDTVENRERKFLCFLRCDDEGIPNFDRMEDADAEMPEYFLISTCSGKFLESLLWTIKEVSMPLIQKLFFDPVTKGELLLEKSIQRMMRSVSKRSSFLITKIKSGAMGSDMYIGKVADKTSKKEEMIIDMNNILDFVIWTIEHVEDTSQQLMVDPELLEADDSVIIKNPKIIENLEELVMSWERQISKTIEHYQAKTPVGNGPIPEYEYWHEREAGLSILVEQLKKPRAIRICRILEKADSDVVSGFEFFKQDLKRVYVQARDNVKFLSTVLRHFKIIAHCEDFVRVKEYLPSLMEGLQMIWILSRFYCTDEQMVPLVERIAWSLCEKARIALDNATLFRKPIEQIRRETNECREMLLAFKNCYLETRDKIEQSGKSQRWEFDRKKLFGESDYIALVCKDLSTIAEIIDQFSNIFGPELKSILNDPQRIDSVVRRVTHLVNPIENADFDVFKETHKENWDAIMGYFYKEVTVLEKEAVVFIDQSFKTLRSSMSALDLLIKFRHIKTRKVILDQLMTKFEVVVDQFIKEIGLIEHLFLFNKREPILCKNLPPHGGAIFWAKLLFNHLKRPVLKFQQVEELKTSGLKMEAFEYYVKVAKTLKSFEQTKFEQWLAESIPIIDSTFHLNILKVVTTLMTEDVVSQSTHRISVSRSQSKSTVDLQPVVRQASRGFKKETVNPMTSTKTATAIMEKLRSRANYTWHDIMGTNIMTELNIQFVLNFNPDIYDCIAGAELMEYLGYELDDKIVNAAIQKKRLKADVEAVSSLLTRYYKIMESLTLPQIWIRNWLPPESRIV